MRHKHVMFDIDGVLADFIGTFTRALHHQYGTPMWGTKQHERWREFPGTTEEQRRSLWERIRQQPSFWQFLDPLVDPDVFYRINMLHADTYFVTARHGAGAKEVTEAWLKEYGIENPTVIMSKDKGMVAKAIEADFAIEDKANNASCIKWMTEDKTDTYLISRPYNRVDPEFMASGVKRIDTVTDFLNEVEK